MTLGYTEALRNTRLAEVLTLIDLGASAAKFRIYDGARPASPESGVGGATLLIEFTMSDPAFPAPSSGGMVANAIASQVGLATGAATWFRILDSDDNAVLDGSVGLSGSGADLEFNTIEISTGEAVDFSSYEIRQDNP